MRVRRIDFWEIFTPLTATIFRNASDESLPWGLVGRSHCQRPGGWGAAKKKDFAAGGKTQRNYKRNQMLLEAALLGCFVYIVGTGKSARAAARTVGYGVGRAAGSLRRVRAEVDRAQARVEGVGGAALHADRAQVAERMRRMRAIQHEALALVSTYPSRSGAAPPPPFSDEELAAAAAGAGGAAEARPPPPAAAAPWAAGASAPPAAAPAAPAAPAAAEAPAAPAAAAVPAAGAPPAAAPAAAAAAGAGVAYYYEGRPVVQATFEHVWDAGSSVPRGLRQQDVADAIKYGRDLEGTQVPPEAPAPAPAPAQPPQPQQQLK